MDFPDLIPSAFFDLDSFAHASLFDRCEHVWEALQHLGAYLSTRLQANVAAIGLRSRPLPETVVLFQGRFWRDGFEILGGDVTGGSFRVRLEGEETLDASVLYAGSIIWGDQVEIGPGCVVEPGAFIQGPTLIGAHTEVRHGAYVRGSCLIGDRCVVGHSTEIKASVMLNQARAGHFAYIGDSILGHDTNLGAGTKLANLSLKPGTVHIQAGGKRCDTGMDKLGAVLGDGVQIGCNAVTNPGTLLGRGCLVLPATCVRSGYHEPQSILRQPRPV